jgi:hypothetical protein
MHDYHHESVTMGSASLGSPERTTTENTSKDKIQGSFPIRHAQGQDDGFFRVTVSRRPKTNSA